MKTQVVFPQELLAALDRLVPRRRRSDFIVAATREKLERDRFLQVVREAAGAWTDQNHPDLRTAEDMELYLADLRRGWRGRLDEGRSS